MISFSLRTISSLLALSLSFPQPLLAMEKDKDKPAVVAIQQRSTPPAPQAQERRVSIYSLPEDVIIYNVSFAGHSFAVLPQCSRLLKQQSYIALCELFHIPPSYTPHHAYFEHVYRVKSSIVEARLRDRTVMFADLYRLQLRDYQRKAEEHRSQNRPLEESPATILRKRIMEAFHRVDGVYTPSIWPGFGEYAMDLRALYDSLAELGDFDAIQIKLDSLRRGNLGYQPNPREYERELDRFIGKGHAQLIEKKLFHLIHTLRSRERAIEYMEDIRTKGNLAENRVLDLLIIKSLQGQYDSPTLPGYERDFDRAHVLSQQFIQGGNTEVDLHIKREELRDAARRNRRNLPLNQWKALAEALVFQHRDPEAYKELRARAMDEDAPGDVKAFFVACTDRLIEWGDREAMATKLKGLSNGYYGWKRDFRKAASFAMEYKLLME
jgi:hypothetical protein